MLSPSSIETICFIPFEVLSKLHQLSDEDLKAYPDLVDAAKSLRGLQLQPRSSSLFSGTPHFVQISFDVNGTVTTISDADMQTMIQFAALAVEQISGYAAQYGSNSVNVSPTKLTFSVSMPAGNFNDHDLQGWVNSIIKANNLPGSTNSLVIPHPRGTTNTDGDATKGIGGYHGKANCLYSYVNVFGTAFTLADRPDTQAPITTPCR